jgi:hypothetical protein
MYISPTRSALIMSLESTFSALLAYIFLHEVLSMSELVGCGLMFTATVLSTTASVEDEEEADTQSSSEKSKSVESMLSSESSSGANIAETSVLEHYLVTKQRTLHRHIILRRSRSRSQSQPPTSAVESSGSTSWRGWINEHTQLLHEGDGHSGSGSSSGLGCILPSTSTGTTPDYGSV